MFYMDYCRKLIYDEKNEDNEENKDKIINLLSEFILYNGYIIELHHSKLKNMKKFKDDINVSLKKMFFLLN